ncbi:hypothetical protein KIW84_041511, partial [Lathyrus oleraceus]
STYSKVKVERERSTQSCFEFGDSRNLAEMEGSKIESESESYAIFESLNLNPQLFFNQIFNTVDDFFLEFFDFIFQEASTKLNIVEDAQRSQHLNQGFDRILQNVQSDLDRKLAVWEEYCRFHCFSLPEGFHMPNTLTVCSYLTYSQIALLPRINNCM